MGIERFGATGGGTSIPIVNIVGAVPVENPSGVRGVPQRLRQGMIDPDFAIASFSKTNPNTSTSLYRRGDSISGLTVSATYVSGPPTSGSIATTYVNTAAGSGAWTFTSPFSTGSKGSTLTGAGTDGGADPTATTTVTASDGVNTRTASFTITWTSDVYYGVTSASSITGTDVFDGSSLGAGFASNLQTNRNGTHTFALSSQYAWFLWPAPYGSSATFKDSNGFTFSVTAQSDVSITRNGVTRTYKVFRSSVLNTSFTVTVT